MSQSFEEPRDLYTIPSSSGWFNWDEIHETERQSLPEFFDGATISRNARAYKEYRDFIISKYREAPYRRLTFTEVRKSLVGDAGSLYKVFLFLDGSGLINFGLPRASDGGRKNDGGPAVVVEDGAPAGLQVLPAPTSPGVAAVRPAAEENGFKLPPLASYSDVFGDPACSECGDQCVAGQYESNQKDGFVKCSKCFGNKNAESNSVNDSEPEDQTDVSDNQATNAWTDAETLLLLEAVLKHGDDWDFIAQHVHTKSKIDCIGKLIQLPFGDHILGKVSNHDENKNLSSLAIDVKSTSDASKELPEDPSDTNIQLSVNKDDNVTANSAHVHPSKKRRFAFADATDALMKQVARLSTVGGPHVAAAAAEAAISALCNENPYAEEAFDIDDNEFSIKAGVSSIYSTQEMDSDTMLEDPDRKRHKQTGSVPEENFASMTFRIRAAIATALGSSAARAKLLADQEEREMELLMAHVIKTQMRKLQHKIRHFEELELIMEKEYSQIQQSKKSILEEWVSVLQQAFHAGIPIWKDRGIPRSSSSSTTA